MREEEDWCSSHCCGITTGVRYGDLEVLVKLRDAFRDSVQEGRQVDMVIAETSKESGYETDENIYNSLSCGMCSHESSLMKVVVTYISRPFYNYTNVVRVGFDRLLCQCVLSEAEQNSLAELLRLQGFVHVILTGINLSLSYQDFN